MKPNIRMRALLLGALCGAALTVSAAAYSDVPAGHWAAQNIADASAAGFLSGYTDGTFGLGKTLTRAEFASMLTRLMGWPSEGAGDAFSDVPAGAWYADAVNTVYQNGAVDRGAFRPNENITREEMAVMLVRALGYTGKAEVFSDLPLPFSDVTSHRSYIAMAYDFGIIAGRSATRFDPSGSATREEAAAMMMRLYDRHTAKLDWTHYFYAISSWNQRELGKGSDISFGWARLDYTDGAVKVNTTNENGNTWRVPDGYADAVNYYEGSGRNLAVQLTDQTAANAILTDSANRKAAAGQIVQAMDALGLDGVTIDFEGMKGAALREGLNAFLTDLRAALGDKPLYVCVHPVLKHGGAYFDAYDYRAIGDVADKVILMAHDYAATTMDAAAMAGGFTTTPVTPFDEVYHALACITDKDTGVRDTDKIALAISPASTAAWRVEGGKVTNSTALHPAVDTLTARLRQPDTEIHWSSDYDSAFASYKDDDGKQIVVWYETAQSTTEKIELARMFGVNGLSVWRLGSIPADAQTGRNIPDAISVQK